MPPIDDQIRSRVDEFVAELSDLIRAAAFQAVEDVLGGSLSSSSAPARRAPGAVRRKKKASRRAASGAGGGAGRSEEVLAHIRSNPGQRLEEMASAFGAPSAALRPSVQQLLAEGRVRTEGQARGTRYFAGGGGGRGATKKKRGGARRKAGGRKKAGRRRKKAARAAQAATASSSGD